jgi:hypothetical protein
MAAAADLYPLGPAAVPDQLTNPTPEYRRHAWIATVVLLLFAGLYRSYRRQFFAGTFPELKKNYIRTGEPEFDVPLAEVFG